MSAGKDMSAGKESGGAMRSFHSDAPLLVITHEDDAGPGRLTPHLPAQLDVRRPHAGDELPAGIAGHVGLLVLGGSMGAWDDDAAPWLPATRRLLAEAVAAGVPALGVCLGAQLLAAATGGRVERGAAGLEVGLVDVRITADADDDPLLGAVAAELGRTFAVPQWHQDAVTRLPPGAVPLAAGVRYPHQAFRLGTCAWGVQYHPEVTAADFETWINDGHGVLDGAGLRPGALLDRMRAAEAHQARVARLHGQAFAALLAPAQVAPARVAPARVARARVAPARVARARRW